MAGFEVVVRPAIFPDIRPPVARSAAPQESDPDKNMAVIHGSSGGPITLSFSWSVSSSKSKQNEAKRRVDIARVYQVNDDGTLNQDNFIEVEVINKLWMDEAAFGGGAEPVAVPFGVSAFVGPTGSSSVSQKLTTEQTFAPVEEADNIEILEKNVIRQNPNAS